jgi:hypothetical protein
MLTQESEAGGVFEYCPNIRTADAENFEDVRSVLLDENGTGDRLVRRLELRPGDLQLFQGRYALHRVSTVTGPIERHSAIFAYSHRPGVVGSPTRAKQLFGRVAEAHLNGPEGAVPADRLLD